MKRDMDLCRKILLEVEKSNGPIEGLEIDGYTADQIALHCLLLIESGFLIAEHYETHEDPVPEVVLQRLTGPGYDYLDSVRDPGVWGWIREKLLVPGGSYSFALIKDVATAYIKSKLEETVRKLGG